MRGVNVTVKGNYRHYVQLIAEKKWPDSVPIILEPKENHAGWVLGTITLTCTLSETFVLLAQGNTTKITSYGLNLRAKRFCPQPLIRFDADGLAHTNPFPDVPLPERQVRPPHFHKFNDAGVEFAYKTHFLNENEAAVQQDINMGLAHFAEEANVVIDEPLSAVQKQMTFRPTSNDPLEGVPFPS